ncbi:MAG: glycoside hydrolase, partial [Actinomycetota bacterium]|nr:glycoside hydrolase [Actinomycetota bacterium]
MRSPGDWKRRLRVGALPLRFVWGAALVIIGAGALAISISSPRNPTPTLLGSDFPVNDGASNPGDIKANNSPALARNPVKPANLAVVNRVDSPRYSCGLHVSLDGGKRWVDTPIATPKGEEPKCFAPDVTFARDGTMYMSFVTLKGSGNVPHAGWILHSTDGGRTLSPPTRVLGPRAFQVRLTADPADARRLYLTWLQTSETGFLQFGQTGHPILSARSDDGGATWAPPVRVSNPARARVVAPAPAVGPDGAVYVLYLDLGGDRLDYEGEHGGRGGPPYPGRFRLVLARSRNRGTTWTESVVDDRIVPTERFVVFLPPLPSIAVDPRSGRVYAGFQDGRLGGPDVWVWSLPRGAGRWEGPTRVNDTPRRDRRAQYLPRLAVAPNGRLDVVYYDRRADRRDVMNEVSLQSSRDQGRSFGGRVLLSARPFDSRVGSGSERGMPDLGNRLGLVSDDSRAL